MKTLTKMLSLCAIFLGTALFSQPINDDCANALSVTVGGECTLASYDMTDVTTEDETISFDPSCGAFQGGDVWFEFTVPASGNFRIDISGSSIQWALLDGTCGSFNQLRCTSGARNISEPSLAGQTLYIQVFRFNNDSGNPFDLCIWEIDPPANDNCQNPIDLTVGSDCIYESYSNVFSTEQDEIDSFDPSCGAFQGGDVWFTFTVPASGKFRVDVDGSSIQWALLDGSCGDFTQLRCTSGARNFSEPSLAGQSLFLQVYRFNSDQGNPFDICIREITTPPNDDCANPTNVSVGNECNFTSYSNVFSTIEDEADSFDPSCGAFQGGDVWFSFTVPTSGNFRVDIDGSSIQWALLDGSCGDFTQLRCTSGARNFSEPSLAGQTLYLQVFRFNSDQGNPFDLCIWEITPPSNDNCANPINLTLGEECNAVNYSGEFSTAEDEADSFDPPCGAFQGGDVWFSFTVPSSGNFRVDVAGGNSQWALLQGSCGLFEQLLCSNGARNFSDPALAGQTLFLQVFRFNSDQGNPFDVCVWEIDPPSNNNCDSPIFLPVSDACESVTYSSEFSTTQPDSVAENPSCGVFQGGDVWFRFFAPSSGSFTIEKTNTSAYFSILTGSCENFTEYLCENDDLIAIDEPALGGQLLTIRAYRFNSDQGNEFDICITGEDSAPNDNCADAIPLIAGQTCAPQIFNNRNTSEEPGIAATPPCGNYQGADVWFTTVVPSTGRLRVDFNYFGNGPFAVALFSGTCGSFLPIACVNNPNGAIADLPSLIGETIYIRVFRTNSIVGTDFGICVAEVDCNGDDGGSAFIDNCETCVGGNTGLEECVPDCNGDFGGTAFIDECDDCVEGLTGVEACVQDCNADFGGTAFIDNCDTCVEGNTGLEACLPDCNGDFGGTAFFDTCEECVGGNTGEEPCCPIPFPALNESALSTQVNATNVQLGWESVGGQVGCQVQLRFAGSSSNLGSAIAGGNADSFTIPGSVLQLNQDYEWRVRCGCSQTPLIAGPFSSWQFFSTAVGASIAASPNPVADNTTVTVSSDTPDNAVVAVFDLNGRQVAQLYSGDIQAEQSYRLTFDASGLPNGVYICRYTGQSKTTIIKIMVAR